MTAIQLADTDGNAATEADPAWDSLVPTPPYPDYTSGLTSVFGAATRTLVRVLGTDRIDLYLTASVAGAALTRHYATADALRRDAVERRIWAGIHFRFADMDGLRDGTSAADWALDRYFRPTTPA